jgi:uncharacterized protein DUF732
MTSVSTKAPAAVTTLELLAGFVLAGALLLGVMGVAAPTALADAADGSDFVGAISAKGITFASRQAAILAGHDVCDELDQGRQASDVASDLMKESNVDGYHAGFFVGVSIAAFCPRHS